MNEKLQKISEILTQVTRARLMWEIDGRFNTATISFHNKFSKKLIKALNQVYETLWEPRTAVDAPEILREIRTASGGLRGNQMLFTTDLNSIPVIFGAWWPWGNGETISLRVGIYHPGQSVDAIIAELAEHFEGLS